MVLLFIREVYLTSLTTGQSFRKQFCGLKLNSFQRGYSPPGKIWSRSFLLNVIQCSPQTQKTKHEYIFLTHLLGSSLLFPPVTWRLFYCSSGLKPYNSCLVQLGTYFPIIFHYTDSAQYLICCFTAELHTSSLCGCGPSVL